MKYQLKRIISTTSVLAFAISLTACTAMQERLADIGKAPDLASIENPHKTPDFKPVSLPMPLQEPLVKEANSLWGNGKQTFFKDQRAKNIGDILTVMIEIDDEADLKNSTERDRDGSEKQGLPNYLGTETQLSKVLPEAVDPSSLVSMNSTSSTKGEGKIKRAEKISLKLAATIIQKLPNGNFVINGRQQTRVNNELRDLTLQGVIRPEDILNNNSISYEKIAEARISYGGKGNISELQQPRYGQQLFDVVFPF